MSEQKVYKCVVRTIETNYIRADCEEEIKEKAVCGDILSNCDTEVFIDEIEVAERRITK